MYLLSICIPTFNREKNLVTMLGSIESNNNIEVVICDDGSTDNTKKIVELFHTKYKIKYIYQQNSGVSSAMSNAYKNASGKFVIKMDSDDLFENNGLKFILDTIINYPQHDAFLFGVKIIKKNLSYENLPPVGLMNFISVRADLKIKGDLKEVVRRDIVLKYLYQVPKHIRRIPPSLLWVKIAENHDCLSFKKVVAVKNYLNEGITSKIFYLKITNPKPMIELYERLSESKVYNSVIYRWRSRFLWARYSLHNKSLHINKWWHLFVITPSWLLYKIDLFRINYFK